MSKKIEVVSAAISRNGATLYLKDGTPMQLSGSGWKVKNIVNDVTQQCAGGKVAKIDLDAYSIEKAVEQRTEGRLKLLTKKIKGFFTRNHDGHQHALPEGEKAENAKAPVEKERMVAVINGVEIAGVEKMQRYFEAMVDGRTNTVGVEKFLERLSKIIGERKHTIDELMNFMERSDLPIADDGSIVAYKIVYHRENRSDGKTVYVDPHSRSVTQWVGARVEMELGTVNEDRRVACSTGLHIARRGYLSQFGGSDLLLVKVAPEDVIAVPYGQPDKLRARGYHIVGEVPRELKETITRGGPLGERVEAMLGEIIAGNHVGVSHVVSIGKDKKLTITAKDGTVIEAPKAVAKPAKSLNETPTENGIDTAAINDKVRESKKKAEAISEAAASGDMSAAVSAEPEEKPKAPKKSKAKKASKPKAEKPKQAAPVDPATTPKKDRSELDEKYQKALKLLDEGMSKRQIEKEAHICRKKLNKLIKEGY